MNMSSPEHSYDLPCSGVQRCLDRFSVLPDGEDIEDENGQVSVWEVVKELLTTTAVTSAKQLAELLETIAITLRGSTGPAGDYGLLKDVINIEHASFLETCWTEIVRIALSMPRLFPSGTLPVLGAFETQASSGISESSLELSREQVACLIVHQFLCTLGAPVPRRTDYYDFSIWYNSQQRHEDAARIYLGTLLKYLEKVAKEESRGQMTGSVKYTLRRFTPPGRIHEGDFGMTENSASQSLCTVQICQVDEYDTTAQSLGVPHGAAVVSANRVIGFGESATQEEIHVGCSPEACPAVLIVPELKHDEAFVVRGAEAISNIVGQRRGIRLGSPESTIGSQDWNHRAMLFMDALELDEPEQYQGRSELGTALPDLLPRNMEREIRKARLAISSGRYKAVISPLWGCGAFGGDPFVKTLLLWCAASLAQEDASNGTQVQNGGRQAPFTLKIVCDNSLTETTKTLSEVMHLAQTKLDTVGLVWDMLRTIPADVKRLDTGPWLLQKLQTL